MQQPPYTRDALAGHIAQGIAVVGEHTYGTPSLRYWGSPPGAKVYIGRYCSIAVGVEIFLGGYHRPDWVTTYPFPAFGAWPEVHAVSEHAPLLSDVVIGSDVWLGERVTIMAGVKIGHGAVIGAGAVVAKDVPPYAIVVGNPGRVVKYRFDEATVAALLEIAWWRWPDTQVRENLPRLLSGDVAGFIASNRAAATPAG